MVSFALGVMCLTGCGGRQSRQGQTSMPSPVGCFLQVWDAPDFDGITEYLNGPAAFVTLRDLPRGENWEKRIRSLKTGAAARATIYNAETFTGRSMVLQPDSEQKRLAVDFDEQIVSLRIDCR